MPERPPETTVAERELAEEALDEGLPADAVTVEVAAVDEGDESAAKKRFGVGAWLALGWLVLLLACCVLAPVLPIPGGTEPVSPPAGVDSVSKQEPFCFSEECASGHPLGLDASNRDMASRLVYGARNSLFVAVGSITIGILIGGTLGMIGGYFRGKLDAIIVTALDVLLSIPPLVLALALAIFLQPQVREIAFESRETAGRVTLTLALGIIAIPALARITRANALVWSQREFVTAARAQGAKNLRIMVREVLPNVVPAMAVIALLAVAVVVIAEASLSLIGAGIALPAPTWGNILFQGFPDLTNQRNPKPHMVLEASLVIFLTVLSLNYLGDAVRERFDVRETRL